MRKHQFSLWVIITSMILLTGFKKTTAHLSISPKNPTDLTSVNGLSKEPVEVFIADATTFQGNKGQTSVEVLVCLSQAASEPVTMEYTMENGSAIAGVDYVATKGSIRFEPGEFEKWITVSIIGEVAAGPDEGATTVAEVSFQIMLRKIVNAIPKKIKAIITIVKNILRDPRFNVGNKSVSVYEVRFTYTGYTSFFGSIEQTDCPVSRNGRVFLFGTLTGYENVDRYDPVLYTGILLMGINMDICSVEHKPNDEDEFCALNVRFAGDVMVELEIDSTNDKGGYINIHHDPKKHTQLLRTVQGTCLSQIAEEQQMVPNKTIASIFNGKDLPIFIDVATGRMLKTLRKGVYSETDEDGNTTTVEVFRKIR